MARAVVWASEVAAAADRLMVPYMSSKGREIESVAKGLAPHGATGSLSRHIYARGFGKDIRVQCTVPYAASVHEGSMPHLIPSTPGNLAFFWEREGRWFRGRHVQVHHPGNRNPNPFLRRALEIVMGGR